ncbi:MAG: radical SAM protein [Candidatus Eisenbacteria bacterium]
MPVRSRIPPRGFMKTLAAALGEDGCTTRTFLRYQAAKELFSLRHPLGARHGKGDGVQLVSLRITDRCNLRCHSCGQWGDNGYLLDTPPGELRRREVPLEVYRRFVDDIAAAGWSPIWYVWGGEPMLYPGILDLLRYIHERRMPISLVTNGTRVAAHAEEIVKTCRVFYISLDGPNAEIHNRQRPGAGASADNFRDVHAALEAVREEKKRQGRVYPLVVPLSCITSYNIESLVDLYRLAARYSDAHILYLTWWIDPDSAEEHSREFERRFGFRPRTHLGWIGSWKDFDHRLVAEKLERMRALSRASGRCPPIPMPDLNTRKEIERYYSNHADDFGYDQCVSIFMTMEVDSNGNVSLCRDYHDYVIGNIAGDDVQAMWNNERARRFRRSISTEGILPACRRCCGLMGF